MLPFFSLLSLHPSDATIPKALRRGKAEKLSKRQTQLPVFNVAQMVALALGVEVEKLSFRKHLVSSQAVVEAVLAG